MPRCREAWASCYEDLEDSIPSYPLFHGNHNLLTPAASSPTSSRPPTPLSELEDEDEQDDDPWPWELEVPISFSSRNWNSISLKSLGTIQTHNLITINTNYDATLPENRVYASPTKDKQEYIMADTALERTRADAAYHPKSVDDLRNKVLSTLRSTINEF